MLDPAWLELTDNLLLVNEYRTKWYELNPIYPLKYIIIIACRLQDILKCIITLTLDKWLFLVVKN